MKIGEAVKVINDYYDEEVVTEDDFLDEEDFGLQFTTPEGIIYIWTDSNYDRFLENLIEIQVKEAKEEIFSYIPDYLKYYINIDEFSLAEDIRYDIYDYLNFSEKDVIDLDDYIMVIK